MKASLGKDRLNEPILSRSGDRAPAVVRRSHGPTARRAPARHSRNTRQWSLTAASFRTWPGSRADVAQDLTFNTLAAAASVRV